MRIRAIAIAGLLLAAGGGMAQEIVNPDRLSERLRRFEWRPDDESLRCSVAPTRTVMNYGFRFQAGFVARVPMEQSRGSGHRWTVLIRVTPEDGAPVYLLARRRLPDIPKTSVQLDVSGGFLLGEGKYRVAWKMQDDTGRVCRADWKIDAKKKHGEKEVRLAIAPNTVESFSSWTVGRQNQKDDAPPIRLTLLVNAAAASPNRIRMGSWDRFLLLGTLGSVLERVPVESVRLVVFNLDQQRELFRDDNFQARRFPRVAEAMDQLELGLVDYRVLQKPRGHIDLLAQLVKQEVEAPSPSDVVVFLGPMSRYVDRIPDEALERPAGAAPRFFYLQYRPFVHLAAALPDSIVSAVSKLKGRTLVISSPGDFARSIAAIERAKH
jgi:hypothetical protein